MPNWKQLYTNVSFMLDKYQNELVPALREQLAEMNLSRPNVVRCKDCKYCDPENLHCDHPMGTTLPVPRKPDDFCSYGERRGA